MIRVPDSLLGLIFLLLGLGAAVTGAGMEGIGGMAVGPGLMPLLIGIGMVVFGAALVVQGLPEIAEMKRGDYAFLEKRSNPWFPVVVLAAVMLYVPLLQPVGFLPLTFLLVLAVVMAGGGRLISSALFSAAVTLVIYALFVHLLRVPLPAGFFG